MAQPTFRCEMWSGVENSVRTKAQDAVDRAPSQRTLGIDVDVEVSLLRWFSTESLPADFSLEAAQ